MSDLLCVGVVTGARGLRGEVRIKSFTANPADLAAYGHLYDETGQRAFAVRVIGRTKNGVTAGIAGVEDRTAAEALRGLRLHIPRRALPEPGPDEYYHADLVGLAAELVDGGALGTVRTVHDFGAGPVLEIAGGVKGGVMVPFTRAVVCEVDVADGRVVIDPPPGLLEPPAPEGRRDDQSEGEV